MSKMSTIDSIKFYLLISITYPLSHLPLAYLHRLAQILARIIYFFPLKEKKRVLTNLSIAHKLKLKPKEKNKIALKSFQNLFITLLEYFYLRKNPRQVDAMIKCENYDVIENLLKNKQAFLLLSAHQANWELPFLFFSKRFKMKAVGRPIKNKVLYRWILSIRQMFGGTIIPPQNAIKQGIQTLKEGSVFGMVMDQAYPESSYHYPLLGTRAWSTLAPALIAHKAKAPIVVISLKRVKHHCVMSLSQAIWPKEGKLKEQAPRLMDCVYAFLEKSIAQNPGDWLWIHNRWKQVGINAIARKWRHDFILLIFPKNPIIFQKLVSSLPTLRSLYPRSFFTLMIPSCFSEHGIPLEAHKIYYQKAKDLILDDIPYQMLLNFSEENKIENHYSKQGVLEILSLDTIKKIAKKKTSKHLSLPIGELYKIAFLR